VQEDTMWTEARYRCRDFHREVLWPRRCMSPTRLCSWESGSLVHVSIVSCL